MTSDNIIGWFGPHWLINITGGLVEPGWLKLCSTEASEDSRTSVGAGTN